jgi:hypothetical protein
MRAHIALTLRRRSLQRHRKKFRAVICNSLGDDSMKTSVYVRLLAVTSLALTPLAAFAQDSDTTKMCIDAFVAQNFPGQTPLINVAKDNSVRVPLALNRGAYILKLSAASRETGRVLATATCTEKRGVVMLSPDRSSALIAAR